MNEDGEAADAGDCVPDRIDALLDGGHLTVTAVFDKPRTPDGPTFEETLLVTPSRLPGPVLDAAVTTAGRAARALGLTCGPVHAELRIDQSGGQTRLAMLELAARSIGGPREQGKPAEHPEHREVGDS